MAPEESEYDLVTALKRGVFAKELEAKRILADVPSLLGSEITQKTLLDYGLWWRPVRLRKDYDILGVTIPRGTVGHISFEYPITADIFNFQVEAPVSGLIKPDPGKVGGIPWHLLTLADLNEDEDPPTDRVAHNLHAGLPQPNSLANRLLRANTWLLWLIVIIWILALFMQPEKGSIAEVLFQGSWWAAGINLCLLAVLRTIANPWASFINQPFALFKTGVALLFGCVLLFIPIKMSLATSTLVGTTLLYLAAIALFLWTAMTKKQKSNPHADPSASMEQTSQSSYLSMFSIQVEAIPNPSERNLVELLAHSSGRMSEYKNIRIDEQPESTTHQETRWQGTADDLPFSVKRAQLPDGKEHWELSWLKAAPATQLANLVRTYFVNRAGTGTITNGTRSGRLKAFVEFNKALEQTGGEARLAILGRTENELQIAFSTDNGIVNLDSAQSIILSQDEPAGYGLYKIQHGIGRSIYSKFGDLEEEYNLTVDTKQVFSDLTDALKQYRISSVGIFADLIPKLMDSHIYIELAPADGRGRPKVLYYSLFPKVKQLNQEELDELTTPCSWEPGDKPPIHYNPKLQYLSVEVYIQQRFTTRFPLKPEELDPKLLKEMIQHCRDAVKECSEPTPSRYMAIIMEALEEFEKDNIQIPFDLWHYIYTAIVSPDQSEKSQSHAIEENAMQSLTEDEIAAIQRRHPWIPLEYLDWMASKGHGEHSSGYRFHPKPVKIADAFGELSPRWTGHAFIIAEKGWNLAIGYAYDHYREEHWELTFFDAEIFDKSPITQSIEAFLSSQTG